MGNNKNANKNPQLRLTTNFFHEIALENTK
jgi:hypothetical protein